MLEYVRIVSIQSYFQASTCITVLYVEEVPPSLSPRLRGVDESPWHPLISRPNFKLPFESAVQRLKDVERCWKFHLFTALQKDISRICCNCPEISSYTSPCHPTTGSQSSSYRWAHGKVSWDDAKQCETICFNFWNKPISQSPIVIHSAAILIPYKMVLYSSHILPIVKVPSNGLSHANHVKGGIFGAFTRQTINLLEIEAPSWVHPQDGLVLATNTLQLDKLMKTEPRDTKGKTRVPNWRTQLGLA